MHKLPAEIDAIRRAAGIADDAYGEFIKAVAPGRRQYEIVADLEAYLRRRGCPDNFMIIGSGGKDVFSMAPPSERRVVMRVRRMASRLMMLMKWWSLDCTS